MRQVPTGRQCCLAIGNRRLPTMAMPLYCAYALSRRSPIMRPEIPAISGNRRDAGSVCTPVLRRGVPRQDPYRRLNTSRRDRAVMLAAGGIEES